MQPILASDFTPMIPFLFGPPILLGLLSPFINARWGNRKWWGFMLALFPTGAGALLLLAAIAEGPDVLSGFYFLAGFPLVCGVVGIIFWIRRRRL